MPERILCSVVIPVFNEELVIRETYRRLKSILDSLNEPYELVFVNDGSRDKTAEIIKELSEKDFCVKFVDFSRNFGHQMASTAGMDYSSGDTVILIDADLQDPPELIPKFIEKWREGYDVVYGIRAKRNGETFLKKFTAKCFYRILHALTDVEIPIDTGDFRLIDRKVCDVLKRTNEKSRFLRGLISWLGFRQTGVPYERDRRFAGETKYPVKKMIRFALDGIASFSYKPLKMASYFGCFLSALSFLYLLVVVYQRLFTKTTIAGWASTLAVSLFFNGIVLIMLGIIGEYIGRIYDEVKGRPLYIVRETKNIDESKIVKR